MARWRSLLVSGPALAAAGGIALMLAVGLAAGQDYNYDLENYHFASAHLLWTGGLNDNVAPSGVQSWFNPIGYIPVMLAIKMLPPLLVSALLAILVGLNAPLIYILADRLAAGLPEPHRRHAVFACTLIGMTGAITMSEAATSFLDAVLSIAELAALCWAVSALDSPDIPRQSRLLGLAGLALGIATGLKLTVAVFAAATAVALILPLTRRRVAAVAALSFMGAGVVGFLLSGGWWAWHLWRDFGNPLFPMANELFRSSWAPVRALNDTTFQPKSWVDPLVDPWHWLIGDHTPGAEISIRDPRYAIGLIAALGVFVTARRGKGDAALLVALFLLMSYAVWLFLFGILRYAVVLEMLSGVVLLGALRSLPRVSPSLCSGLMIGVALLSFGWTRSDNWGRAAFTHDWFGVHGIAAVHRPGTLYVMPDDAPLGFMVGLFPPDARFVHIDGNMPLDPSIGLGRRAAGMIARAPILRTLAAAPNNRKGLAALDRFGLIEVPGSCLPLRTKIAPAESCLLVRTR